MSDPLVLQNGNVIFPRFPFDACNLDSRCITRNSPSWSAPGIATLSRGCLLCSPLFVYFFFLYSRCIFLPAGVKLFQDANGRFIRSGEGIDRAIRFREITKPPALRHRVPNMKYATVKRIHRILQIMAPMWLVTKYFKRFDARDG